MEVCRDVSNSEIAKQQTARGKARDSSSGYHSIEPVRWNHARPSTATAGCLSQPFARSGQSERDRIRSLCHQIVRLPVVRSAARLSNQQSLPNANLNNNCRLSITLAIERIRSRAQSDADTINGHGLPAARSPQLLEQPAALNAAAPPPGQHGRAVPSVAENTLRSMVSPRDT